MSLALRHHKTILHLDFGSRSESIQNPADHCGRPTVWSMGRGQLRQFTSKDRDPILLPCQTESRSARNQGCTAALPSPKRECHASCLRHLHPAEMSGAICRFTQSWLGDCAVLCHLDERTGSSFQLPYSGSLYLTVLLNTGIFALAKSQGWPISGQSYSLILIHLQAK